MEQKLTVFFDPIYYGIIDKMNKELEMKIRNPLLEDLKWKFNTLLLYPLGFPFRVDKLQKPLELLGLSQNKHK